jgi:hypothetical protein
MSLSKLVQKKVSPALLNLEALPHDFENYNLQVKSSKYVQDLFCQASKLFSAEV